MKVCFWILLSAILYIYAGYPLCIALLARCFPRRWKRTPWPLDAKPRPVSVIMAVHNGAALLPAKLEHLLSLEPELIREIIVVSDGSTDETNSILTATSNDRLRAIILPAQAGKASAVNHGVAAATGDILLFNDIRPFIAQGAVASLLENFADPKVGCVAGELILKTLGHDAAATAVSGVYWRYEQWIRNCEAVWDSPVGVYGGFYAVRREAAVAMPAGTILDDMFQPLAIIRQGYRSVLERSAVVFDTWPEKISGEFSRKVRTLAGNFQLVALAPWTVTPANRVVVQLISHKLLRLIVPYLFVMLLAISLFLGISSVTLLLFAIGQIAFWCLAILSLWFRVPGLHRLGTPASALLVLNAAAVVGLYKFLFTRGPLWKIWSPTSLTPGAAERS